MGVFDRFFKSRHANKPDVPAVKNPFRDIEYLEKLILDCLHLRGAKGARFQSINQYVLYKALGKQQLVERAWANENVRQRLKEIRMDLKKKGKITYNSDTKLWRLHKIILRELSEAEAKYLQYQDLKEGWRKIASSKDVVEWIYTTFSPLQFEQLCISILTKHCQIPIKHKEKRKFSGADDGYDGRGTCLIDGKEMPVLVEIKRYNPSAQLGSNLWRNFHGTMDQNDIKHGFFISTGIFSDRFKEAVQISKRKKFVVEIIDGERLVEIMSTKTRSSKCFGVYKSPDYGFYYINEKILKDAAR